MFQQYFGNLQILLSAGYNRTSGDGKNHVSFGTQDVLQESARLIRNIENIPITAKKHDISEHLNTSKNRKTLKIIDH
jgi:hypothetical protein